MPGDSQASLIDWRLATRTGARVAGRDPFADSYLSTSVTRDIASCVEQASGLVADYTGLSTPGSLEGVVLTRSQWIEMNAVAMQRFLAPLAPPNVMFPVRAVARITTGVQLGLAFGFMAQRVLGQYDAFFADTAERDAVFFVGGNVVAVEQRFAFRPRDFRLWIALHEVTHRAQFVGVPWLRPYFTSLIETLLAPMSTDMDQLRHIVREFATAVRSRGQSVSARGLLQLIATPAQQRALDDMQALMSLLEGHGNLVMNAVGREYVYGQERMADAMTARRSSGGISGVVAQLLGLQQKFAQYETGETFLRAVTLEAGPRAIDAAWRGPEYLPTREEFAQPTAWLQRVGA
jgi:coenzyme F420 biosynthesis associated uncharacterized protein